MIEPLEARIVLAVFVVTTADDSGAGSLRRAIADANASQGSDIIEFDEVLRDQTIRLTSGELTIEGDTVIGGLGADALTIDGQQGSRVFSINAGASAVIRDLSIVGGVADTGGGILNQGSLFLLSAVLSGNEAIGHGGALASTMGSSTVTLRTTIMNNVSGGSGGGIYAANGAITLQISTVSSNTAGGDGGGIF